MFSASKFLALALALATSASAFAMDARQRQVVLANGEKGLFTYEFVAGSGDVAFEAPYFNQLKDVIVSFSKKQSVEEAQDLIAEAVIVTTKFSTGPGSVSVGTTETRSVKLKCAYMRGRSFCSGLLGSLEAGSVYQHGGDYEHISNRIMIITNQDKVVFNASPLE